MNTTAKVRDHMSRNVVTLDPQSEVLNAVHTLLQHEIAAAPVVSAEGTLLGIITERDCIRIVASAGYHSEYGGQVGDYMSADVDTIDAEASIVDAAKLFYGEQHHRYPVVEKGRLVGFLSRRDVLRALLQLSN